MSAPTESSTPRPRGLREALGGLLLGAVSVATLAIAFVLAYGEAGQLGAVALGAQDTATAAIAATPAPTQTVDCCTPTAALTLRPVFESTQKATPALPTDTPTDTPAPTSAATETDAPSPTTTSTRTAASATPTTAAPPTPLVVDGCEIPTGWSPYIVRSGDTLFRLSLRAGASVAELQQGNCLSESSLVTGQVVYVPGDAPPEVACGRPAGWAPYTVQPGDTLFRLSQSFGTTVYALQQANCLGSSTQIAVGSRIYAPPGSVAHTPTPALSAAEGATVPPLSSPGGPTATGFSLPSFAFAQTSALASETDGAVGLTVTRTGNLSQTSSVGYQVIGGSAAPGVDYTGGSGTLTFGPGEGSKTILIALTDDAEIEADETITLALVNPSNAQLAAGNTSATVTVVDDDPLVGFASGSVNFPEANADVEFAVALSAPSPVEVRVQYRTAPGNATPGVDYHAADGTIVFEPGSVSKSLRISILDDAAEEVQETFSVLLEAPANATLGAARTVTVTIVDDDSAPEAGFSPTTYVVTEGTPSVSLTVTLSAATVNLVAVDFATAPGSAVPGSDYGQVSGSISFGPYETSKTVTIQILDDGEVEGDETFAVHLSGAANATLAGGSASATVTIVDNDS